jgi:hypothetical protein
MKKFIAAVAVLTAILVSSLGAQAQGTAWSNGQSPSQPYKGVPPVDLQKKLGYMVLDPLNNENVGTALTSLKIYLPRADVKAGAGALRIREAGVEAPLETISFADASRVTVSEIEPEALAWLYWESGVCFTVALKNTPDADKTYAVSMDAGCIVVDGSEVGNPALNGEKGWTFTTNAEAGVLSRERLGGEAPKVGDSVAIQVKLGGSAVSAMVFCDTLAVTSDDQPLSATGTLTARYDQAGVVKWGVALMDAGGALLDVYHYEEEVQP